MITLAALAASIALWLLGVMADRRRAGHASPVAAGSAQ
jgi:hypothetical protein